MLISSDDYKTKSFRYLRQLWEEREFSDVTLVTSDNKQIHSHKFIIYQSSKLFKAILENSRDKIPLLYLMGVDSSLLEKVLEYIYLGECELEDEKLPEFLELGKTLKFVDEEKSNNTVRRLKNQPVAQFNVVDQIESDKQDDEKILNTTETNISLNCPPEIKTFIQNITDKYDIKQEVDESKSTQRTESINISCSKCEYQTDTPASMEDHKKIIHLGTMYTCDNCQYQSDKKDNQI